MQTLFQRPDQVGQPLYVVTSVFNSPRYRKRWKLYEDFVRMCDNAGAILYTVEVAFGDRKFAVTEAGNPRHIQLRTRHEIWIKENALNLAIQRLPLDWQYVAWIDADVSFARHDWANETIHQLQHYDFLQMWTEAVDLSEQHEILTRFRSFIWCYLNDIQPTRGSGYYGDKQGGEISFWHPGYAWAARRDAINKVGGLMDWAILGGGDLFMARSLVGLHKRLPDALGSVGKRWLKIWERRADRYIKRNVGAMEGMLLHYYHGPKASRRYKDRGQILVEAKFNPETMLKRDDQGLWQLESDCEQLRDDARRYFHERNEDAI
jgi:hypothetical protein